jgi:hypothetical protein
MTFTFRKAVREQTPLLIGLVGPSGSGKTLSALRLSKGIQSVRGGKMVGIDTEARRMLHYADHFDFEHMEFTPPFGSDRYSEALVAAAEECENGVVIVDSMSHEHEGAGGYLETHEFELDRMAGDDYKKRDRMTFTAWIKPAAARRRLINKILQLNCAFVFCFRAKEKLKIMRGAEPIQLGWQAIAGDEFAFEMTVRCLLPAGAGGIPDWSQDAFQLGVPKLPKDLRGAFTDGARIDEKTGLFLAEWASGKKKPDSDNLPL